MHHYADDEPQLPSQNRAAAFMVGAESEDEESSGDERVIVRSAKDKRLEEMETAVKVMENASKINDWVAISAGKPFSPMKALISWFDN